MAALLPRFLRAKSDAGLRPVYVRSLRQLLAQFSAHVGESRVDEIEPEALESFLSRFASPASRSSNQGRLASFFGWCRRRGYLRDSPTDRLDRIRLEPTPPPILTVTQSARLTHEAALHVRTLAGWLGLTLFAGIRPAEAEALTWADVDLARGLVNILRTKNRRRRVVPLRAPAFALLSWAREEGFDLAPAPATLRRHRRALAGRAGIAWAQDVLRHTCATYWVADGVPVHEVADYLGHSPEILRRHYREVATREQAAAFWSIELPAKPQK